MKVLVIIPTYNEVENISLIVPAVRALGSEISVLVVDDSSPDGTGDAVKKLAQLDSQVFLLTRPQKQGLGRAYISGFEWGLAQNYDVLIEMDADFSHRPEDLKGLVEKMRQGADFVVGSRYVKGGGTLNWGLGRKIISRGGSLYSRLILGFPLNDWTGGFNAWSRQTLEKIQLASVKSNGYSFQIELKFRAQRAGCKGVESPILFEDRRAGQSKMSTQIVLEAFWRVWKMRFTAPSPAPAANTQSL